MIKYIIVDDEPIAHRIVEGYCKDLPHLELQGHCYDALQAMQFLNEHQVDLMFLDINMPKLKGFEFLKTLSNPPKVIVTTAYKEFAIEGYELNVSDYLLKPFSFERFVAAVNKATGSNQNPKQTIVQAPAVDSKSQRLFLKGDKKHHQINIEDILFIEAYGNYTKVFVADEMIITHEKISSYQGMLPEDEFIRVHKSFVVATSKINLIEGNQIKIGEHNIPIGQTYRMNINKLLS